MLQKDIPKFRFKDFDDEWEKAKLGDHAIIKGRLGWKSLKQDEYTETGPNMIVGKHIKDGIIDWNVVDHIPEWRYEESPEIMLEDGDGIFSKDGSLGNPALIEKLTEPSTINSTMMLVRTDESIDSKYFYQIMKSSKFDKLVYLKVSGSSIPHLFQADMTDFKIEVPSLPEQSAIGSLFQTLDELLSAYKDNLANYQAFKASMLSKMFPKAGQTTPEIRLDGFDGEWEEKKLGDLAEIVRGASPGPIQDPKWFDDSSEVGWLRISDVTNQNGRIHYLEQRISELGQEKTRVLKEPHLLLSIAASVGKPVINYVQTGVHDGFLIFLNPTFDKEFMFQWLEMFKDGWNKYGQPGSQVNLNSDIVRHHKLKLPTIEEQQAIGNFFTKLDNFMISHQEKIDQLETLKKKLLQEMFL